MGAFASRAFGLLFMQNETGGGGGGSGTTSSELLSLLIQCRKESGVDPALDPTLEGLLELPEATRLFAMWASQRGLSDSTKAVREAVQFFDHNGDGKISLCEVLRISPDPREAFLPRRRDGAAEVDATAAPPGTITPVLAHLALQRLPRAVLSLPEDPQIRCLASVPQTEFVIVASVKGLFLVDVEKGETVHQVASGDFTSTTVTATGKIFAVRDRCDLVVFSDNSFSDTPAVEHVIDLRKPVVLGPTAAAANDDPEAGLAVELKEPLVLAFDAVNNDVVAIGQGGQVVIFDGDTAAGKRSFRVEGKVAENPSLLAIAGDQALIGSNSEPSVVVVSLRGGTIVRSDNDATIVKGPTAWAFGASGAKAFFVVDKGAAEDNDGHVLRVLSPMGDYEILRIPSSKIDTEHSFDVPSDARPFGWSECAACTAEGRIITGSLRKLYLW